MSEGLHMVMLFIVLQVASATMILGKEQKLKCYTVKSRVNRSSRPKGVIERFKHGSEGDLGVRLPLTYPIFQLYHSIFFCRILSHVNIICLFVF